MTNLDKVEASLAEFCHNLEFGSLYNTALDLDCSESQDNDSHCVVGCEMLGAVVRYLKEADLWRGTEKDEL